MRAGYTYILGSPTGTLYIGVTSNLFQRVLRHRAGLFDGFSKTHGCTRLLYYEKHEDIRISIAREKQFKGWRREKKLGLIRSQNPAFRDQAETWGWPIIGPDERIADQIFLGIDPLPS